MRKEKIRKFLMELVLCLALAALAVVVAYFGYTLLFGETGAHLTELINGLLP
jgi:type VI protein secretion system component VasF